VNGFIIAESEAERLVRIESGKGVPEDFKDFMPDLGVLLNKLGKKDFRWNFSVETMKYDMDGKFYGTAVLKSRKEGYGTSIF